MKITLINFLIFSSLVCLVGLIILAITAKPIGRKVETNSGAYIRILKIEGREYIISDKPLTPHHPCSCKCDSIEQK
jgi:hypothetical protein